MKRLASVLLPIVAVLSGCGASTESNVPQDDAFSYNPAVEKVAGAYQEALIPGTSAHLVLGFDKTYVLERTPVCNPFNPCPTKRENGKYRVSLSSDTAGKITFTPRKLVHSTIHNTPVWDKPYVRSLEIVEPNKVIRLAPDSEPINWKEYEAVASYCSEKIDCDAQQSRTSVLPACLGEFVCTLEHTCKYSCAGSGSTCVQGDKKYGVGEKYVDTDGCNTCTCMADGKSSCTELACP